MAEGATTTTQGDATDSAAESASDADGSPNAGADPDDVAASPESETYRAVVLLDCYLGKLGDIVELDSAAAHAAQTGGYIDTHPNAIAAAETARA